MLNKTLQKLFGDISSLYLNEEFSDVILNINGEKLYAHKALLAVRSSYFKSLVHGDMQEAREDEITIHDVPSLEAFKLVLKYIYTGDINVNHTNVNRILEVLIQSHKFCITDLEDLITEKLKDIMSIKNIADILNIANVYTFSVLKDECYAFLDNTASKFLKSDNFIHLSQESLTELLHRDTFFAPEIEIFKGIVKWLDNTRCEDKSWIVPCIRLGWMAAHDIVAVVRPAELINNEILLNAIAQTMGVEPKTTTCRGRRILRANVASLEEKAEVLRSTNGSMILQENFGSCYESHKIGDKNGIIIKLEAPTLINYVGILLYHDVDQEDRKSYSYYIEVSIDFINWNKIIDYSEYKCRYIQNLYFKEEVVLYIRVVGTYSVLSNGEFRLSRFKARYRVSTPQLVEGLIRPDKNVATESKGAIVCEGRHTNNLLSISQKSFVGITSNYTLHRLGSTEGITIQLNQPYVLSSLFLMLYDLDNRKYRYMIQTSFNKVDWETVVDFRNEDCESVQNIIFSERPVVFIRIVGTFSSLNDGEFRCSYFECPSHMLS